MLKTNCNVPSPSTFASKCSVQKGGHILGSLWVFSNLWFLLFVNIQGSLYYKQGSLKKTLFYDFLSVF